MEVIFFKHMYIWHTNNLCILDLDFFMRENYIYLFEIFIIVFSPRPPKYIYYSFTFYSLETNVFFPLSLKYVLDLNSTLVWPTLSSQRSEHAHANRILMNTAHFLAHYSPVTAQSTPLVFFIFKPCKIRDVKNKCYLYGVSRITLSSVHKMILFLRAHTTHGPRRSRVVTPGHGVHVVVVDVVRRQVREALEVPQLVVG